VASACRRKDKYPEAAGDHFALVPGIALRHGVDRYLLADGAAYHSHELTILVRDNVGCPVEKQVRRRRCSRDAGIALGRPRT
jgi:hypothetical protein